MNSIVTTIVEETYKKYGKNVLFREYDFKAITVYRTTAIYRVQSAINFPYIYEIQMHIFDKVKQSSSIMERFHKCLYCNKKKADYKMKCCNKYLHLECGMQNKFSCCHLQTYLASSYKNECCICLEETCSITKCGHNLCLGCLQKMYSKAQKRENKITLACPLCRQLIIEENNLMDFLNVKVDNKEEVVCISFI